MTSLERVIPPPIGVESTLEANGMGPCSASLARMIREVEVALAENAAAAMKLEAVMATVGAEVVGSDAYSRAWELVPLVLVGDRVYSEMVTLLEQGRRRVLATRTLQAAARFRLRRPLGPNRESHSRAGAVLPGSVEMWAQGCAQDARLQRLRHGAYRVRDVHAATARRGRTLKQWLASDPAAKLGGGFLGGVPRARRTQLAIRMQRGAGIAVEASINLARAHAARRIQ